MPRHQQLNSESWLLEESSVCVFSQCPVEPCLWIPYDQFRLHSGFEVKLHIAARVVCVFHSLSSRQTHNLQLPQSKLVLWYGEWQQLQTQHAGMAVYCWNLLALTYSFLSPHWGGIGLGLYIMVDHTHFLYCMQERTTCLRATLSLHWLLSCWNSISRKQGERYVIQLQWSQTTPTSCLHYHLPAISDIICRDTIVHNY